VREATRRAAEFCDSLQCFFLLHSLGGGTGSGLGTFILGLLEDDFPGIFRFATSVFPSEDDDVITSPYNSVLSTHELIKHADCVLPLENQQLADISTRIREKKEKMAANRPAATAHASSMRSGRNWIHKPLAPTERERSVGVGVAGKTRIGDKGNNSSVFPSLKVGSGGGGESQPRAAGSGKGRGREGFDGMNAIAARLLTHLTSSMRFPGQLNTDMNEISTNLVPFPHLHFLCSSLAPLDPQLGPVFGSGSGGGGGQAAAKQPRQQVVRQLFSDAFSPSHQLLRVDQRKGTYLASALLLRGDLSIGDVNTCMAKLQPSLSTVHWNSEGFKVGLCSAAALEHPHAVLCLTNNTCIAETFDAMLSRFSKLYSRRAMVHHFSEYMGDGDAPQMFASAHDALCQLSASYREFDNAVPPTDEELRRIVPFV
jgi:tubulin epsilon